MGRKYHDQQNELFKTGPGKAARKEVTDLLIKLGTPAMDLTSNMK